MIPNTPEKVTCSSCKMSFVVDVPTIRAERSRCSEPGCKKPFWHYQPRDVAKVRCGIIPDWLPEWQT